MDVHYRAGGGELDPNVLYASSNRLWRTTDGGTNWEALSDDLTRADPATLGHSGGPITGDMNGPGLPDMPATDVIPEHDELAMASHGRGFWVLDNVGPLRQSQPGITEADLVLFEPAPAYRSANGAVIAWWMGDGGGDGSATEATLEILDAGGQVVRTFEVAREGEERDRWSGPSLPAGSGLQRLRWDLRTDPAATFPGMILWGVRTMAPVVPPGTYQVRLTVGDRTETIGLEVRRNPRIEDVTDEDLVEQYEFGVRFRDQVDRANRAVIEIRRAKAELAERLDGVEDARLAEAAERLRVALEEIEGEIYQVRNRSKQDPLNFPIKVNNRLANLLSMSERGDGRPGSGMCSVFEIMVERLDALAGRLGELGVEGIAARPQSDPEATGAPLRPSIRYVPWTWNHHRRAMTSLRDAVARGGTKRHTLSSAHSIHN